MNAAPFYISNFLVFSFFGESESLFGYVYDIIQIV